MQRLLAIVVLIGCLGCNHQARVPEQTSTLGDSLAKGSTFVNAGHKHVSLAIPLCQGEGLYHVRSADDNLASGEVELSRTREILTWWENNYQTMWRENQSLKTRIHELDQQWIGNRTWRLIGWIALAWAVLGLASVALTLFVPGIGATIGLEVLRLLPLSNPFLWIRGYVLARRGAYAGV